MPTIEIKYLRLECAYSLAKVITEVLKEEGIKVAELWKINNAIREKVR